MRNLLPREVSRLGFCLITLCVLFSVCAPQTADASAVVTIKGRLIVNHMGNPDGIVIPVANAQIDIFDEEIIRYPIVGWARLPWPDVHLGTVYTSDDGYFSFTVNNDDGSTILGDEKGRDLYLKVRAANRAAVVRNNPEWMFGSVYELKVGTFADMADGEVKNIPLHPGNPDYEVAFEILSNIDRAWKHVRAETGMEMNRVNVFYKDSFHTAEYGSYYFPDQIWEYLSIVPYMTTLRDYFPPPLVDFLEALPDQIGPIEKGLLRDLSGLHYTTDILDDSTRYYEVIYHEYGHYTMNQMFEFGPPFSIAPHYADTEYNPQHAWIEGWAEFYSAAARKYLGIPNHLTFAGSINIENLGFNHNESKAWDSIEGNIAGILWDIHDDTNEAFDGLTLSFSDIVTFLRSYDPSPGLDEFWPVAPDYPWNIQHVFEAYRHYYSPNPSISKLWALLKTHGINIEDTDAPQNPTSYTSSHNSVIPLNDSVIRVDFNGAFDSLSGIGQYYCWMYYEPEIQVDPNDPNDLEYIANYWRSSPLPHFQWDTQFTNRVWYLYVIARDAAGNFAREIYRAGPFLVLNLSSLQMDGTISIGAGEIFANSFTQVAIDPLAYPGKDYQLAQFRIFDQSSEGEPIDYSTPFYLSGKNDGSYTMQIFGVSSSASEVIYQVPLNIDNTAPDIYISVGSPHHTKADDLNCTYVNRNTVFTIDAVDAGSGLKYIEYSLTGSDWTPYTNAFTLPGLSDGFYVLQAKAADNLGNTRVLEKRIYLDNTSPDIQVEIGHPMLDTAIVHITSASELNLISHDAGSGIAATYFQAFDDVEPADWTPYTGPFFLPESDAVYHVRCKAIDVLGNEQIQTYIVVNDNIGPELEIVSPHAESALQDVVDFRINAQDISGITGVTVSIRNTASPDTPIGLEKLEAVFDSSQWVLRFNTLQLLDGEYRLIVIATDALGNSSSIQAGYSIRNGTLIQMLPACKEFQAGRTIPVKFSLKVIPEIDSAEPFVHNENLEIRIYQGNELLQVSVFGEEATDYRISAWDQLYITNFKTLKTAASYTVAIYRMDYLVDSFDFVTAKP